MRKVDRIVKGLGAGLTLSVCLSMTAQSGGCLNPALGIAQSIYMIGLDNRDGSGRGTTEAKYMWVYIVGPLVGSIFAAIFFILHDYSNLFSSLDDSTAVDKVNSTDVKKPPEGG